MSRSSRSQRRDALGASAPVDDLGLVDLEAVVVGGSQAWRGADGAIDIGDGAAGPAHDVVVVVAHPSLVSCHRTRRLDTSQQSGIGQCPKHVVHGLMGHLAEVLTHDTDDRVRVGMRVRVYGGKHRQPRTRHPQSRSTQHSLVVRGAGHTPEY